LLSGSSIHAILADYFKRVLEKGYCEIYVSHDVDSIVAASMIARMLSAHNSLGGVYPAPDILAGSSHEDSLLIGSRPPRHGSGLAIIRRKNGLSRVGEWGIYSTQGSIAQAVLETISHIYQVPRDLRSAAIAGHMAAHSRSLLFTVDDRVISSLGDIFGSDAIIIKEGLKIMGFGAGEPLEAILENTLDPYLPGISGNRGKASEISSLLKSQDDRDSLKAFSKAINDLLGTQLVYMGLKPIYRDDYPFVDPYELHLCILGHAAYGSPEVSAYISTGMPGLSKIAYNCIKIKRDIITYLSGILDRDKKVSTYSIKGKLVTIYPNIPSHIIWPVHKILGSISHYQGYAVYETTGGYVLPIESPMDLHSLRNFKISAGFVVIKDLQEIPEIAGVLIQ